MINRKQHEAKLPAVIIKLFIQSMKNRPSKDYLRQTDK